MKVCPYSEEPHLPLNFGVLHGGGEKGELANVVSVIRELEKIELIRLGDGKYRMDHAITARQKDVLRIFDIGVEDMKEKLGKEAETLWISSAANGKENKKNGETD